MVAQAVRHFADDIRSGFSRSSSALPLCPSELKPKRSFSVPSATWPMLSGAKEYDDPNSANHASADASSGNRPARSELTEATASREAR